LNGHGEAMTKYVLPIRVYLEDTDAQGVVYNASYFRFMERARTECLRACGIDHDQLREEHGVVLVLAAIEARFRAPARLSDMLYVSAYVEEARGARMRFAQHVRRDKPDGDVVCEGSAEVACMDARGGKPRRLPKALISELSNE
jgi:tol-pal system-associated acyl-CoA thioesterase